MKETIMKKISIYIIMVCLVGLSAYAGIAATRTTDSFAENALKAGSFPLEFVQDSSSPWQASNGYVVSTNTTAGSRSSFSATFNVTFKTTLSFEWCATKGIIRFNVDGEEKGTIGNASNYTPFTYELTPGSHTIEWSYENQDYDGQNNAYGYVKNIFISPTAFVMPGIAYPSCSPQLFFGDVIPNHSATRQLTIHNIGSEELVIDNITFSSDCFTTGSFNKKIPALSVEDIPIMITPTQEGEINETATITFKNATDRTITLSEIGRASGRERVLRLV